ncbi:hypothetical protein NPIL_14841 [Nephila pilipes]|uniref:Uncharacterized protein n=1 Tax=Nephila pilipes TaxID=299642 RepID=A0A8X6QE23_NEPPI|nr:hypothetical protein NPIL_14841 [Nephila pilipes]
MKSSLLDFSHKAKCIYALPKSPMFRLTKTLSYALTIHYTVIFNAVCIHDLSNVGFSPVIRARGLILFGDIQHVTSDEGARIVLEVVELHVDPFPCHHSGDLSQVARCATYEESQKLVRKNARINQYCFVRRQA